MAVQLVVLVALVDGRRAVVRHVGRQREAAVRGRLGHAAVHD